MSKPSPSAPLYTSEPGPGEQRLGIEVSGADGPPPSLQTLTVRGSGITIALKNQPETTRQPVYGRNAPITGEISLSSTMGVASVQVILAGKVTSSFGNTYRPDIKLVHLSSTLWETGPDACPSILPFSLTMPESFVESESGSLYPLPPSFNPARESIDLGDMHVRCVYRLSVQLVRNRWIPNSSVSVDIGYAPRTIPPREVINTPFPFFETIKSGPEEWYQTNSALAPKAGSTVEDVQCELFTPSVRVFKRGDEVPFFLQIRGANASMSALYGTDTSEAQGSPTGHRSDIVPQISASIKRAVILRIDGFDVARSYTMGTGSVRPIPASYGLPGAGATGYTINYEGEIQLSPDPRLTGISDFNIGSVRLADFVVISVHPSGSAADQFSNASVTQPIRIVTG